MEKCSGISNVLVLDALDGKKQKGFEDSEKSKQAIKTCIHEHFSEFDLVCM